MQLEEEGMTPMASFRHQEVVYIVVHEWRVLLPLLLLAISTPVLLLPLLYNYLWTIPTVLLEVIYGAAKSFALRRDASQLAAVQ